MDYQDRINRNRMQNDDFSEDTRVLGEYVEQTVNPAAPVSHEALSKSKWALRGGIALGAAGIGAGAIYASSGSGSHHAVSGLAPAATPDPDDYSSADTVEVKFDDPYDLPNSVAATRAMQASKEVDHVSTHRAYHEPIHPHPVHHESIHPHPVQHESIHPDPVHPQPTLSVTEDVFVPTATDVRYAHVTDDMSFGEAFAAARQQVGAPGFFTWHGQTYGTYYAEEWNMMSAADRNLFLKSVSLPMDLNNDIALVDMGPDALSDFDSEVRIIDVTHTMNSLGDTTTSAHVNIDGTETYFVDLDGDGFMDTMQVDLDGDGVIDESIDTIVPIRDMNISVAEVMDMLPNQDVDVNLFDTDNDMASLDLDMPEPTDF